MSTPTEHPIDLSLWRRVKTAPKSDLWKWGWDLWDPISDKIYSGEASAQDLTCPVCGEREVYAYFLAIRYDLPRSRAERRRVYMAERWFGCHNCETQVRDWGSVPAWVRDSEIRWATQKVRERAEMDLAQSGLELPGDQGKER